MIINVGNDQSLGDLQQKIGERSGNYSIVLSYIFAVFFGIISIILVYLFFKNKSSNDLCTNFRYNLFIAGFCILFSIIIILCRSYNKFVHSSRQNAQIGAGITSSRNIYIYWCGSEYKLISILRDLIYLHSKNGKGYTLNIISDNNINEYIKNIPEYFSKVCYAHQADFVRVHVICDYGGIWLDSDTLVLDSLDSLFDK